MLPNSNTNLFFSHTNRLGLEQPSTSSSTTCKRAERKTAAARPGLEWTGVTVLREHPTTPHVKCMYCGDEFTAGATLIRKHMLDKCTCDTDAFCEYKDKLNAKQDKSEATKRQKTAEKTVDAAAEEEKPVKKEGKQTRALCTRMQGDTHTPRTAHSAV